MTQLSSQADELPVSVLQFVKCEEFTTFNAEFALDGDAIVYHFYPPPERVQDKKYWEDTFPNALSNAAEDFFKAGFPRLRAAFTQEMNSWWMRAEGFANEGLPSARSLKFFEVLDQSLDPTKRKS